MSKYYYSLIVINKDDESLTNYLENIKQQEIDLNKIEIIIETTKLAKETKEKIKKENLNIIIREQKSINESLMYNDALKISKGKIINFTNSLVTFEQPNTLQEIYNLSEKNKVITTSIYFLNPISKTKSKYVFSNLINEEINLHKQSNNINLSLESFFINNSIVKKISFDKKYNLESKTKYIVDLYETNNKIYNIGEHSLLTEVPFENNKKLNTYQYDNSWYEESLDNWYKYLKKQKTIPTYLENIMMYLLYIKYNSNLDSEFKHESITLEEQTKKILDFIKEENIIQSNDSLFKIPRNIKQYFYKISSCKKELDPINYEEEKITIQAINYKNGKLIFDAKTDLNDYLNEQEYELKIIYNNKEIPITRNHIYSATKSFNKIINQKYTCQFEIDITNNFGSLEAHYIYKDKEYSLSYNFNKPQSRLDNNNHAFWNYKNFIIRNKTSKLIICKKTKPKVLLYEMKYCLSKLLRENNKVRTLKLIFLRFLYYITKPFLSKKHIWLTYDKLYKGGDNGEYLYQYGLKNNNNIYYLIKKDAPDYKRLIKDKNNRILIFNSLKAKLYSLHSEVILKTHAGILGFCGFDGRARLIIRDLINAEVMEAQHGLTIQDIPEYQNRIADNNKLYIIASPLEDKNISQDIYDYKKEQIKYTGISRYDGLISNDKKQILITPTWRHSVASASLKHGTVRAYNNSFKESDYYKIFNTLINNKKLIETAKKYNYKLIYLIHPTLSEQINDFDKNEYVDIYAATGDVSYEKLLTESSVMVTDYSGVQYDFAYMRKPIVYFHPEELPPHYNNGSIDYEKDGFGPITKNIDSLVEELCNLMKNECKNTKEYIKRANKFFTYDDHNNSKRIIEEVEKYLENMR